MVVLLFLSLFLAVSGWRFVVSKTAKKSPIITTEEKIVIDPAVLKAQEEERKKAEEERKRKEEEEKFIASYGPCKRIPILMYHHIDNNSGSLYVDPGTFASQMDYLIGKGYTAISLLEVVSGLNGGPLPAKPVALTFDDGYRDFFSQAYPILRQKNLKATVFLITQLMEGGDYLTWEQAREMIGSSLITAGDHTLSHRGLGGLKEEQIKDEIISSKSILENQLKTGINVFAYPYGNYNQTAAKYLQEAGFVAAVTTDHGVSCAKAPYSLRRIRIGRSALSGYGL